MAEWDNSEAEFTPATAPMVLSGSKVIGANQIIDLPEWAQWKGEGPAPKKWQATTPEGVITTVYRSYADYCDD